MLDENRKDELLTLRGYKESNFAIEDDKPIQNLGSIKTVIFVDYGLHLSCSMAK